MRAIKTIGDISQKIYKERKRHNLTEFNIGNQFYNELRWADLL